MHCIRYSGKIFIITRTWIGIRKSFQQSPSTKVLHHEGFHLLHNGYNVEEHWFRLTGIISFTQKNSPNIMKQCNKNSLEKQFLVLAGQVNRQNVGKNVPTYNESKVGNIKPVKFFVKSKEMLEKRYITSEERKLNALHQIFRQNIHHN